MMRHILVGLVLSWLALASAAAAEPRPLPAPGDVPYPGTLTLKVDVTDVARRIYRVHEAIPVSEGPMTLLYPQWVPGNHSTTGPLPLLAGLTVNAAGKRIEWQRDPVSLYAFHLQVPRGVTQLEVEFEFLTPQSESQGRIIALARLLEVQWHAVVMYPAGFAARQVQIEPTITVPSGWELASALDVAGREGATVHFKAVTLETLIDSPVYAGAYFKRVALAEDPRWPVHLNVVAESPEQLLIAPAALSAYSHLVREAAALFASHHYDHYDFLLALSDQFSDIGLEHHRSSENRHDPTFFTDWAHSAPGRDLLAHEYSHSWNGKFRRPADLASASYNVPMQTSLLWVYEGMTEYWGAVLAARSGLWSVAEARAAWADAAARIDKDRPGRQWRDLADTTNQPIMAYKKRQPWGSWQRSTDYYSEGALIWLDVDTRIRELTHEKRSLDDFAKAFFGTADGERGPLPYTFEDVAAALEAVVPGQWASFLNERVHSHGPGAPLDGLTRSGWKLALGEELLPYLRQSEETAGETDLTYSLGLIVSGNAELSEVHWGGPAYEAGLAQGVRLIAVNGVEYSAERLKQAVRDAKGGTSPIELLIKREDRYRTVPILWPGGLQYPHLERIAGTPDRLTAIMTPRVGPPAPAAKTR